MEFKEAIKLLQQAETRAVKAQREIDAAHIQFDNIRSVIGDKYRKEWAYYCHKYGLAPDYDFSDVLA